MVAVMKHAIFLGNKTSFNVERKLRVYHWTEKISVRKVFQWWLPSNLRHWDLFFDPANSGRRIDSKIDRSCTSCQYHQSEKETEIVETLCKSGFIRIDIFKPKGAVWILGNIFIGNNYAELTKMGETLCKSGLIRIDIYKLTVLFGSSVTPSLVITTRS
ncbi:uncharacterized protein [Asterias amurensis]|uniref:uncharacterized protein n=1 Tax=Asterias amurensis TaxID=7602 RepID=UPI003AB21238